MNGPLDPVAFRFRPGERETLDARLQQHAEALRRLVVAIDGPAGSGKSTTARAVAQRLGLTGLDTGAMYRSLTLAGLRRGIAPADGARLAELLRGRSIEFETRQGVSRVFLDGEDVSEAIRSPEVTRAVSAVSAHPEVRHEMVRRQRQLGARGGVVLEGRDIGTVVFPKADLKVFLTADAHTRAMRRQREDEQRGAPARELADIEADIRRRDHEDSTRSVSPLVAAPDAVSLDTSGLDFESQVSAVLALALRVVEERDDTASRPELQLELIPADATRAAQPGFRPFHSQLHRFVHGCIRLYYRTVYGARVFGQESAHFPGSMLVACNHIAGIDPPLAGSSLPFECWYIAKLELFRHAWSARLIRRFNAIPIRRGTADYSTLDRAVEALRGGRNVFMFLEGTRQRPGRLGTARWGFGYLALRSGRPILPVFVRGSRDHRPRGLRREPLEIWIGDPVELRVPHGVDERQLHLRAGELVMERIALLMRRSAERTPLRGLEDANRHSSPRPAANRDRISTSP